jgi:excisionase family DNA binding protein
MSTQTLPQYYTVDEVADALRVSRKWIWALCRERRIDHVRFGKGYRFTQEQFAAMTEYVMADDSELHLRPSKATR